MTMLIGYRHMMNFFKSIPWWTLEPCEDLAGEGTLLLADKGKRYAAYLPNGGIAKFTLEPNRYSARWYNPRTGTWTELPIIEQAATGVWTSPQPADSGDWAITLESTGK